MAATINPIIETYSQLAARYDDDSNLRSCWGAATDDAFRLLRWRDAKVVLDVGCGTGGLLWRLAAESEPGVQLIGVEPADGMRERAIRRTQDHSNIRILNGRFEEIPLARGSVDYLYSVFAFHWTTDLDASVAEIARVSKPTSDMDLFFVGRNNAREFVQRTTPVLLKHMGASSLLSSANLRKHLTREAALELFGRRFDRSCLSVEESYHTYYDTLEGHWGWWVRTEGHFVEIPPDSRQACTSDLQAAIETLAEDKGIPYTIHRLHVKLASGARSRSENR